MGAKKSEKTLNDLVQAVKDSDGNKTKPYDTTATVTRVEDGKAWVHIPGGVTETPAELTINAKPGDNVMVRVAGGRAFLLGNATNPPTDDATAKKALSNADEALQSAINARIAADSAESSAETARTAAESAVEDASTARTAAESAQADAASAKTSANQAKADAAAAASAASEARNTANAAKKSADNANEYAARALGGLSTVQSVTETLNWITQHGTMTRTTDTALDPTHVYFVRDNNGDYVVGNVHYSVVTEPKLADIPTYYELSIDESLNNYVATHLAVTSEGLWIIPDAGGNKVLIATGQGSTYTTAGTYIVGSDGGVLAKFAESEIIVGKNDNTEAYLKLDYHSMQIVDKEGVPFFHVSDLRDSSGQANITQTETGDGVETTFDLLFTAVDTSYSVKVNGTTARGVYKTTSAVNFNNAPAAGAIITIDYKTASSTTKAFTLGTRKSGTITGAYSVALGYNLDASGNYSHAEGDGTTASGESSHAEGLWTIAAKRAQTAIGKFNLEDTEISAINQKALIIGNGTSDSNRSNALTVGWNGNVKFAGKATGNNGTRDIELNITEATIAKYVALGMSLS